MPCRATGQSASGVPLPTPPRNTQSRPLFRVVGYGAPLFALPIRKEMSQVPVPALAPPSASASLPAPKLRSCVVCRSRKVRCDKQSPCSNCSRANIVCIAPPADRPPRWARRLERLGANHGRSTAAPTLSAAPRNVNSGQGVENIMERLRNLENLVKELSGQLEQAHASAVVGGSTQDQGQDVDVDLPTDEPHDAALLAGTLGMQKHFGRLVLQDTSQSRYVSSGFWSRVNDEASLGFLVLAHRQVPHDYLSRYLALPWFAC